MQSRARWPSALGRLSDAAVTAADSDPLRPHSNRVLVIERCLSYLMLNSKLLLHYTSRARSYQILAVYSAVQEALLHSGSKDGAPVAHSNEDFDDVL